MTVGAVWRKSLADARRGLVGWALGLAALVGLTMAMWPAYSEALILDGTFERMMEDMPPAMRALTGQVDLASAQGYVASQLFGFLLPLLLIIQAVGWGAAAIAGAEERGHLETLVSLPLSRRRVLLERWAAAVGCSLVVGAVVAVALVGGALAVDLGVAVGDLLGAVAATVLLAVLLGAVALAVGAATGRRAAAITVGALVAVAAWFVDSFAPVVDTLEPLQVTSPFYWAYAGDAVSAGLPPGGTAALVATIAVLVVVAVVTFERRDLTR